jgi:glycosyltransferase involved in cell wall biosynthesis
MGKPVVATSKACQALSVSRGQHLLIADDPKAFADAVVKLLLDDNLAVRLGREGRRYVEEHHNWNDRAVELERVYENAQRVHWGTSRLQPGDVRTGS